MNFTGKFKGEKSSKSNRSQSGVLTQMYAKKPSFNDMAEQPKLLPSQGSPNKPRIYRNKIIGSLVLPSKLDRTEILFERKYSPFNFLHKKGRRFSSEDAEPLAFHIELEE
jgi:hypothetical protein